MFLLFQFAGLFSAYELGQGVVFTGDDGSGDQATRIIPACALLAANGGAFFMYAWRNFFRVQRALQRGQFIIRGRGLVGLATGSLLSACMSLLIVVNPHNLLDWRAYSARSVSREEEELLEVETGPEATDSADGATSIQPVSKSQDIPAHKRR